MSARHHHVLANFGTLYAEIHYPDGDLPDGRITVYSDYTEKPTVFEFSNPSERDSCIAQAFKRLAEFAQINADAQKAYAIANGFPH